MLLPFTDGLVLSHKSDRECAALADRHYSRRTIGSPQFVGPGSKLVLRDSAGTAVWMRNHVERWDHQPGYCCVLFRNESSRVASSIILEAEQIAVHEWGPSRVFTYVNPRKVRSVNPGYCFKVAGWRYVTTTTSGLHLLEKAID
jgi:hypothetical protein